MQNNYYSKIKSTLLIILLANFAVALVKIAAGYTINSSSLQADGFHSLTDGFSNIAGLIGIYFASKPIDEDHPYGHYKFETLAALFIAVVLFFLAGKVVVSSIKSFINPPVLNVTTEGLIALLLTLLFNIFISIYEYNQGKKLESPILISDSMHTRSDIFISLGVLFTLVAVKLGAPPVIDSIASIIVAGFIVHAAIEIFKENCGVLMDQAVLDAVEIKAIVLEFEEVKDVHKIRSRGFENKIFVDMHVMLEPRTSIETSHRLMHDIEDLLCKKLNKTIQAIIHVEPWYTKYRSSS